MASLALSLTHRCATTTKASFWLTQPAEKLDFPQIGSLGSAPSFPAEGDRDRERERRVPGNQYVYEKWCVHIFIRMYKKGRQNQNCMSTGTAGYAFRNIDCSQLMLLGGSRDNQCCGSKTFWYGSGSRSADPCLWLMDPDPAIFVIDLQEANKKLILKKVFLLNTYWRYIYINFQR